MAFMGMGRWANVFAGNMGTWGFWEMSDIEYDTQLTNAISLAGI